MSMSETDTIGRCETYQPADHRIVMGVGEDLMDVMDNHAWISVDVEQTPTRLTEARE